MLIGFVLGGALGAGIVAGSKASRLADDAHEVKQDYDKVKGKVADDYKATTEAIGSKGKEVLGNMDAKELGEGATEGTKEVGRALKDRLINEINGKHPVDAAKERAKTKLDAWKAMLEAKKAELEDEKATDGAILDREDPQDVSPKENE